MSPGLHAWAGRKMLRQAKHSAINAAPMNIGRYGSSVRLPIHALEKPSATSTSGPRQQVEARMAAKPLAATRRARNRAR